MSIMDNKPDQQNCIPSRSSATNIQHLLYISLTILSLIFISISAVHFLVNDKTLQTIIQVIAYILGTAIGIILFLIAHHQRKTNHPHGLKIMIFLYIAFPALLLGIAYFFKIIGDVGAVLGFVITVALVFYEKLGKSKESDIQENPSNSSPKFLQENSSTSIQNNLPISIQNNNNSPISIQNNITTNQNVTNNIDKKSERERATAKAYEMLASKDSTSRIFGVKMLVNLADSWLDDSDPTCKKDEEKCQDIIDILCAYIRSPFPLAEKIEEYEAHKELEKLQESESEKLSIEEHSRLQVLLKRFKDSDEYQKPNDITADYAKFHEEQDVRSTIFAEISKRSSTFDKDNKGKIIDTTSGTWSGFDFDFSRAPIFYPLNSLTIEKAIFSSARFYGDADFVGTEFTEDADFLDTEFTGNADFVGAKFTRGADFRGAEFTGNAHFGDADFGHVKFAGNARFECAEFTGNAHFEGAEFTGNTDFVLAKFTGNAHFVGAEFTGNANFRNSTFTRDAYFWGAYFTEKAYFTDAKFTSNTGFNGAYFEKYTPTFADIVSSALFSAQVDPQDYYFSVGQGSKSINCGTATLLGNTFEIPLGTVLFDPMSPKYKDGNYSGLSEPAE